MDYYGGFSFDNCARNEKLFSEGLKPPKGRKTGTTIAGAVFKDGVVLGADTRATEDTIVADKNCSKIHHLSKTIYCCGAGTAADTEMVTRLISGNLELMRLRQNRPPRVCAANTMLKQHLYRYQGHIGAALVLGGVDEMGAHLYSIHPHGSTDQLPYIAMGSGSLAAMSVLESYYKKDMSRNQVVQLIRDAISSGIFNDLGSGSNIDICVITMNEVEYIRPYEIAAKRGVRQGIYTYNPGTTVVIKTVVEKLGEDILGTEVDEYSDSEDPVNEPMTE